MTNPMRIDTLSLSRKLEAAGLSKEAADALSEALRDADTSELATKNDISEVRGEMSSLRAEVNDFKGATKAEFAAVRGEISDLRAEIKSEFAGLYKHLWVMGLGIVGMTAALVGIMVRLMA